MPVYIHSGHGLVVRSIDLKNELIYAEGEMIKPRRNYYGAYYPIWQFPDAKISDTLDVVKRPSIQPLKSGYLPVADTHNR